MFKIHCLIGLHLLASTVLFYIQGSTNLALLTTVLVALGPYSWAWHGALQLLHIVDLPLIHFHSSYSYQLGDSVEHIH